MRAGPDEGGAAGAADEGGFTGWMGTTPGARGVLDGIGVDGTAGEADGACAGGADDGAGAAGVAGGTAPGTAGACTGAAGASDAPVGGVGAASASGEMSGAGPPTPKFDPDPTYIGCTSLDASSCPRTICAVMSITMSVESSSLLLLPRMDRSQGTPVVPGRPFCERDVVSCSRPAIRRDSPSRSAIDPCVLRETMRGKFCPATVMSVPRPLFSSVKLSRMISSRYVTRGVNSMLTPTLW